MIYYEGQINVTNVWHYHRDTVKKARAFLTKHHVDYEFYDFKKSHH